MLLLYFAGIRQWLARKKMIKLAEACQRQALAVQNLLTTISKSGVNFHAALQLTNEADVKRFEEKRKQEEALNLASTGQNTSLAEQQPPSIPFRQGREGNYVNVSINAGKVSTPSQVPMSSAANHARSASPDKYLLQTSPQYGECTEEIYEDVITQPVVRQVQRIQSVHIRGKSDDDFIPLTTASQLIVHQGSMAGESDELYENLAGVKQESPAVVVCPNGNEVYDDAASLQQHQPDEIYDDAASLRQDPLDEIYNDPASLMQNPPDEIYDDAASLKQNPLDEIYNDPVSLMQNPPDEIYDDAASLKQNPQDGIYSDPVSLMQNPPDEIYDDAASLKQNPLDEIYNDPVSLMQSPPVSINRSMLSPIHRVRTPSPTPPPIPPRSPATVITTLTRNGERDRSISSPPPPIPARSPATRLSSNRHPPHLPEDSTVGYGTKDEAPPIPPRSPDTKLTTAQRTHMQTPLQLGGNETPPLPPRRESLPRSDKSLQLPNSSRRRSAESIPPPSINRADKPKVTNLPSNSFQNRLSSLYEGGSPAHTPPTQTQQQQRGRIRSEPAIHVIPILPAQGRHMPSNSGLPKCQPYEEVIPLHASQKQATPLPPVGMSHNVIPATQGWTSSAPSAGQPQAIPAHSQLPPTTSKQTKQPPTPGSIVLQAPPVGHPFNPQNVRPQHVPPTVGQPSYSAAQAVPVAPSPPPPLIVGQAGAPVPSHPFPIIDPKFSPAVPTAPPPPSVGVPQAPIPPPPPTPPIGHPFNPQAQATPPAPPPPPPTPPVGHPFNPQAQVAPPAPPPPPPTPPAGHPFNPQAQAPPPAPPPPAIGQARPKVPSTGHQPVAGGAKLTSKAPPGPPGMGDLLAGLSDVKLRKASDRSLPGMALQLPSMTSVLMRNRCVFKIKYLIQFQSLLIHISYSDIFVLL